MVQSAIIVNNLDIGPENALSRNNKDSVAVAAVAVATMSTIEIIGMP